MREFQRMIGLVPVLTGLGLLQFLVIPPLEPKLMIGLLGAVLFQLGLNALFLEWHLKSGARRASPSDRLSSAGP
jgi:cadmium resistance protein CadD (predicted permease)